MDLTYSFLQDTEPDEMQLELLMREVADEARKRREEADEKLRQMIYKEVELAEERSKALIKND
jgi:hypothetical protein